MTSEVKCIYDTLVFNEACVNVKSTFTNFSLWLYELSSDCVSCPYKRIGNIADLTEYSIKVHTAKSRVWRIFKNDGSLEYISARNKSDLHCELSSQFYDFGLYNLTADESGCNVATLIKPLNSFLPLYSAIGIIVFILSSLSVIKQVKRTCKKEQNQTNVINSNKRRICSIDTVRGISILLMIFVNDGAGGYPILEHATWNGLLMGDLVFPCFMWIMGLCIPLSLSSQLSRGVSRSTICLLIIKRSILLFLFGISLNTLGTDALLKNIRIFGVLQRFCIAYIMAAFMYILRMERNIKEISNPVLKLFSEFYSLLRILLYIIIITVLHFMITFYLPVPNCPRGYTGPGGNHGNGKYRNCTGGAAGLIDQTILGSNHLYQYAEIVTVYGSQQFDPEGILGSLTSIVQTLLGIYAGEVILCYKEWKSRVIRWLFWALMFGCVGLFLHFKDIIPVNKNLWSISFVLVTTCFCLTLFTICYLLIDVLKIWEGGPFRIPGMNALVMYIGHQMCYQIFPFHWKIGRMHTHTWVLAETLWGVMLWVIIAYILHHKKIYINL